MCTCGGVLRCLEDHQGIFPAGSSPSIVCADILPLHPMRWHQLLAGLQRNTKHRDRRTKYRLTQFNPLRCFWRSHYLDRGEYTVQRRKNILIGEPFAGARPSKRNHYIYRGPTIIVSEQPGSSDKLPRLGKSTNYSECNPPPPPCFAHFAHALAALLQCKSAFSLDYFCAI
jgi:hypothetical protein